MTQEERNILLQDLCARLPYEVKIHINSCIEEQNHMQLFSVNLEGETIGVKNKKWVFRAIPIIDDENEIRVIKPYLRPMLSMTKEEKGEYLHIKKGECNGCVLTGKGDPNTEFMLIDFYNKHHLDYRGLIEKGLAIAVTEENNPYKQD